jgi:hypothetical protein
MALVGSIIGLRMFFEIGLVLLMPVIYLVSRRSQLSLITVGSISGWLRIETGWVRRRRSPGEASRRNHAGLPPLDATRQSE